MPIIKLHNESFAQKSDNYTIGR